MRLFSDFPIRGKLVLVFASVVAVILAFTYVYLSSKLEVHDVRAMEEKAGTVAQISALCVRQSFLSGNRRETEEIIKNVMQAERLVHFTVVDDAGRVFASLNASQDETNESLGASRVIEVFPEVVVTAASAPILSGGQEVGRVSVGLSPAASKEETGNSRAVLLSVCLIVFGAGVASVIGLSMLVAAPVKRLVRDANRATRGDLTVRVGVSAQDEAGELESVNQKVEQRVTERMHDLEEELRRRARAEEETKELTERLLMVIETVNDGITFGDGAGRFEVFNATMEEITGYTKEEANAFADFNAVLYPDPRERQRTLDCLQSVIEHGPARDIETTIVTKNGSARTLLVSTIVVKLREKNMFLSSYHDITERQQAEKELRLLAQTVASTKDSVSITDLDDRFIFVNDAFVETYGYTEAEVLGQKTDILRSPATLPDIASQIAPATLAGGWYGEILNRRKDGSEFPVELWTSVVNSDAGNPVALVGVARDISARKRAEERLSKLNACLVSFGPDSAENIDRIVTLCGEELTPACAMYNRLEDGYLRTLSIWNMPPEFVAEDRPDGHICYDVIRNAKAEACILRNLDDSPYARTDPSVVRYGLKTYVGKAVSLGDTHIGSLCLVYKDHREPNPEDIRLLEIAAYAIGVEEKRKQSEIALREAQRKLTTLVDNLPGVVYRCLNDSDWTMEYLSEGVLNLTGYESSELTGNRLFSYASLIHEADREGVRQKIQESLARRQHYVLEYRILTKSGQEKWVWEKGGPIVGTDGQLTALEGFITDITERKRAEKVQGATYKISHAVNTTYDLQELYRAIHAIVSELMVADNFYVALYDEASGLLSFPYFVDALDEWSPPKKPGRGLTEYVLRTGKSLLAPPEVFDDLVDRGEAELIGAPSIDWLGVPLIMNERTIGVLVAQTYSEGLRYSQEEQKILEFVASQVTVAIERQRVAEHLERTVSLLRATLESTADGTLVVNNDGKIETLNRKFVELWRIPEEILHAGDDKRALDYVKDQLKDPQSFVKNVTELYSQPDSVREDTLEFKDGRVFERYSKPQKLGGETVGRVWSFRDVTEQRRAEQELLLQKSRFEQLYENIPLGVVMLDDRGRIIEVNSAFESIFQYSSDEVRGLSVDELIVPPDWADEANALSRRTFQEAKVEEETVRRRKDGTLVNVRIYGIPIRVAGKGIGIYGIYEDITERKRRDEQLRQSEEMFRLISETAGDLIAVLDLQGRRLYNSPSYDGVLGSSALLRGSDSFQEIHPEDRERIKELFTSTIQTGVGQRTEFRFMLKDGSIRYIESQGSVVRDAGGKVKNVVVVSRDITDRKRAEEQIREQAALLNVARDAIVVRDLEGRILFWNKGAERLYGWSADEVCGRETSGLFNGQEYSHDVDPLGSVMSRGEWTGELVQTTRNGEPITVESRWTLVRNSNKRPQSILIVSTDITEKRLLESQFRRAQRMEIIGTLAGGIAHDLNNVLAPILMALSMLRERTNDTRSQQMLTTIETSAKRGADIIKQVLTFARGVEGERVVLQPKHLLREVEKIAQETFPRGIEIRSDISQTLSTISGDATQLHQVIMNLTVNARDAMPNGGVLTLTAKDVALDEKSARMHLGAKPGTHVVISVIDTGMGIPSEIMDKIFDPFFTTKPVGKGTGLGLASVLAIVKSHGGFVNVQSEVGHGTSFQVYLPAAESVASRRSHEAPAELTLGHGEVVLVVDDEASIREITKETLETFGYRVMTAQDGSEALSLYTQTGEKIDVVLTDMMMPNVDGATVIRMLRALDSSVRIIAASGLADASLLDLGDANVQAFITKPFTSDKLLSVLHAVLQKN